MPDVQFWENRYAAGNTPWDLAGPSPHFITLIQQGPDFLKPGKMAVLGSGRGHDAALFAAHGFEVTGFDYAAGAIQLANKNYGDAARFEQADVFELADPASPYAQTFDYVLEHTCFCAISPSRRADYAKAVRNLLKPGGYLLGVFWEQDDDDGPPYNTTEADITTFFSDAFDRVSTEKHLPAAGREGIERLVILRRKTDV